MVGLGLLLAPVTALTTPSTPPHARLASDRSKHFPKIPQHASLAVSVKGNHLVNAQGQTLQLVGVNRSGSQYMCVLDAGVFDGPVDAASITEMKSWHINTVRVPLNEDCWLGINDVNPADSGVAYRYAIEAYVARLNAAGLYVILNVCWNAPGKEKATGQHEMLDASHGYRLWRSLATAFKAHPAVLFDLYNEPYGLGSTTNEQWRCWKQGCGEYAGMSKLVATVRSTGARNVILLGGLDWAADDSEWLKYEPHDPLHQLAATFHIYYDHTLCTAESCWSQTLRPLAAHVPLVADEFGEMQCGDLASLAWLGKWMSYAANNGFSMLAWAWNLQHEGGCSPPFLITNYTGSPSLYGAVVEDFYATHDLH
ncbi:MAG TPA: cellulase family glycosylhydrolase [Solirubrobacteraceae bacterium]|nr:cellulase family glycosylhydrolase [Solirubrobacteraceae bacterium]